MSQYFLQYAVSIELSVSLFKTKAPFAFPRYSNAFCYPPVINGVIQGVWARGIQKYMLLF